MKKKNGIPAIALVLFLSASLWGCQRQKEEPGKPEGYQIYYINKEETAVVREPYEPEGQTTEELLDELLACLKADYPGYEADFVFNPRNNLLHTLLLAEKAEFDPEQQKMVLKRAVPCQSSRRAALYSAPYREQYIAIHRDEGRYWTAEKVLAAPGRFRVLLAIEDGQVVGYTDVTCAQDENEFYDVFVKKEFRRKGYGKAVLARAIECNGPGGMMALVDAGDAASVGLYEALGFLPSAGENSITARVLL